MSIAASNFVRQARGLTPTEKLVAFVIASHCNHVTGICSASMATIAAEGSLSTRQANRIVQKLFLKSIILTGARSRGRKPTSWKMNFAAFGNPDISGISTLTSETPNPDIENDQTEQNQKDPQGKVLKVIKGLVSGAGHHHHPKGEKPKSDDDDAPAPKSPHLNGNDNPKPSGMTKSKGKTIPSELMVWARTQILKRGNGQVRNRTAYLKAAEPEFFKNLGSEIDLFLTERAETFLQEELGKDQTKIIPWEDVFRVLQAEVVKHKLPVDGGTFKRVTRSASEILGLVEIKPDARPN